MKDVVCIYSGGMDSFTMVGDVLAQGRLHSCLSFNYGQRHKKELKYAAKVCEQWDVPHYIVDLQSIKPLFTGTALLDEAIEMPEGHYAEETMKQTVVPNRNMIMLSIAAAYAMSHKINEVQIGAHAGDHAIYPDCRPRFLDSLGDAIAMADYHPVELMAPYLYMDKTVILQQGMRLGLNYADSWTCYKGGELACGTCGSCQERLEAFANNGIEDPLEYLVRRLIPKEIAGEE